MRKINDKNQIWFEENAESVRIGFTQSFLDTLDQCWHILPSNTDKFKLKAPLLTVETNDALISIMSPVAGNFMNYSDKAQNFPDRLTESDVIMELSFGQVVRPQARPFFGDAVAVGPAPQRARVDEAFQAQVEEFRIQAGQRGAVLRNQINIDIAAAPVAPVRVGRF